MQRMWDLAHALNVRSKRMAKKLGVTGPQRLVIRVLGRAPDSSASDIAQMLGMHPSTLSGVLRRLEGLRAIERRIDDVDRRRVRFRLTRRGAVIDRERKGTVEAAIRRALARASEPMVRRALEMFEILTAELGRDD